MLKKKAQAILVVKRDEDKNVYATVVQLEAALTDLEELPSDLRVLSLRPKEMMLVKWYGRIYKRLLKEQRLGLAGHIDPTDIPAYTNPCSGPSVESFDFFEKGIRDNLFKC